MKEQVGKEKKKKKLELPDTLIILLGMILVATVCTFIIPAGEYKRVLNQATNRQVADPASFHYVAQKPVGIMEMFFSIPQGLIESANIVFLTLICGAVFHLVTFTGALDAGLNNAIKKLSGGKKYALVFGLFFISFLLGLRGSAETLLPFVPLAVAASIAMGFDSITGTALVLLGGVAGTSTTFMDTSLVIAQGISELPVYSGAGFRLACSGVTFIIALLFILRYCRKLDKDPAKSSMYESDRTLDIKIDIKVQDFTARRKAVLATFVLGIAILMVCIAVFAFSSIQVTALYFMLAVAIGIAGGYTPNLFAKEFVNGCKSMMYGALIIGFARPITTVMTKGLILDTITHAASGLLSFLPASVCAFGMFIVQGFLSIVVPSGSGQVAVTMPIMAPLADFIGVTRQTAIVAYSLSDSFINLLTPTSGYFMAAIGISQIPWTKWVKWYIPLLIAFVVEAFCILSIATIIHLGPF